MEKIDNWILALDTCTSHLALALTNGEQTHAVKTPMVRGLSEALFPALQEALTTVNITMENVERVAYTRGPGSFTSVRIGITAAKGLVFGSKRKLFGWNTLQVIAKQYVQQHNTPCQVWLAAHGRNVFVQHFDENANSVADAVSMKIEEAIAQASGVIIGDALYKYPLDATSTLPEGATWVEDDAFYSVNPEALAKISKDLSESDEQYNATSALYVHPLNYDKTGA